MQLVQNKMLRTLNGTKLKDKVSTASLLAKFNVLSVNQINAQIKLQQVWKALHVEDYPLQIKLQLASTTGINTRASESKRPVEIGKSNLAQSTSTSDAIRIWNLAPDSIKLCLTVYKVKKAIKEFVKSLPI